MRYRDLAKRLKQHGCLEGREGKGSHRLWHNPKTGKSAVIPDWSHKDLKPGTVRGIIRQLGISRKAFGSIK